MKKFIGLRSVLLSSIFLSAILLISSSCTKSSDNSMTGMTGGTGGTGGSGGPGPNEVFIQGMAFSPSTISITVNTAVTWINKDGISHTVTSDTGLFDSGTVAPGGTYSYTFNNVGTFAYHCKIHPSMTALIVVNPAPAPGY